jgi:hypothetical protein
VGHIPAGVDTQEKRPANIEAEMAASTTLLQFLLMLVAGWLQRQQAAAIDYLKAENRMLRERLGGRRIVFTDAERRQLGEKARVLGRKALRELGTINERFDAYRDRYRRLTRELLETGTKK